MAQNNTLTIGKFWKECLAKWKWFCYSVVTIMLLAVIYLVVTPPKYTRKAQVLIKEENGMGALMGQLGGLAELGGLVGLNMGSANVYNELYAMQSPWLLLNVIHSPFAVLLHFYERFCWLKLLDVLIVSIQYHSISVTQPQLVAAAIQCCQNFVVCYV